MSLLPSQHRTWSKVRDEGRCRICGLSRDPRLHDPPKNGWVTGHHLVPRNIRGGDIDDNIVPLCFRCHKIIDSPKATNAAQRERLRRHLRTLLTPEEVAHCVRAMGQPWLDRNYPLPTEAVVG